jgi:L-lactate dehydrogenase complex protein LldE
MRVQLFGTCLVDTFFPDAGEAVVKLLRHFGVQVVFPRGQTCCGKPPSSAGYEEETRHAARRFLSVFKADDPIVIPSGSCASMVKTHYPALFKNEPQMKAKAEEVAARTYELSQFLVHVLKVHEAGLKASGRITYHASCQLTRELGVKEEPLLLLESLHGAEFVHLPHADRCCGFGGTFAVKFDSISAAMADQKVNNALASGAQYIISTDLSCLMHISSYAEKNGLNIKTMHLADVLVAGW